MAHDHRVVDTSGNRLPFTCENWRFRTNTAKGFPHSPHARTLGSVLENALIDHGDFSLWLEHVVEIETGEEIYWLMWYGAEGQPTIPMSGVFGKDDLEQMVGKLTRFVP